MAFTENLSDFFNPDDFGFEALYGPDEEPIHGLFDMAYLEQRGVAGTNPVFWCREADVIGITEGYLLTVSGLTHYVRPGYWDDGYVAEPGAVSFTIRGWEPDGTGVMLLQLERRPNNGFDAGFDAGFGV